MKNRPIFFQVLGVIIALIITYSINLNRRMSANWMGPYLSAAHNLEWSGDFNINIEEVIHFKELNVKNQDSYKFKSRKNLTHYNHNPIGYAYLIKGASMLFPFVGHQMAIILLQCLVFLLVNILFLKLFKLNNRQKWLFFILFSVNPLVLSFVPFNFYYFWQIIPSVIFGYLLLSKKPKLIILFALILILPFIIITRPTVVFSLLLVVYLLYKRTTIPFVMFGVIYVLIISFWLFQPIKKNIWHTVYTGFGAYSNSNNIELNDNSTYKLYTDYTGKKLNASIGGNYYDTEVIDKYSEITRSETLRIFNESPITFIKNAFVNTLQGFSIGYINKAGDTINYFIAFSGLILIGSMLFFKKYIWFLMIGLSIGTFTLYYPPIQSYMYGVYLLLALYILSTFFKIKFYYS